MTSFMSSGLTQNPNDRQATLAPHLSAKLAELLETGNSLIIKAWPSPTLCRMLQAHLAQVAARGNHVIVVEDESGVGVGQFGDIGRLLLKNVFFDEVSFAKGNGLSCPISRLGDILLQPENASWIARLRLILVPAAEQIFQNPFEWELFAKRLEDRFGPKLPQFVVVIGERLSPESSLRSILPVFPDVAGEMSFRGEWPDHVWWTLWSTQAAADYAADQSVYCGIEPVLGQFAGSWGVKNSHVLAHPAVASTDQRQNLQKDDQIEILYQEDRDGGWLDSADEEAFVGAISLRDFSGNPWKALRGALEAGSRDLLVNIVSQHSLLTQYQLSNAAFFARNPLDAICPAVIAQDKVGTVIQLLYRIRRNDRFALETLRKELMAAALIDKPEATFATFKKLVAEFIGASVANSLSLSSRWDWREGDGTLGFGRITYVRLGNHDTQSAMLDWLRVFTVCEENAPNTVLGQIRAEHVWQTYMPGQACIVNGKIYQVKSVNWQRGHIYVFHLDTLREPVYREARHVKFALAPEHWTRIDDQTPSEEFGDGLVIESALYETAFEVVSGGYAESEDHWASAPKYRSPPKEIERRPYPHGRLARLSFRKGRNSLLTPGAAVALAQWLNEAAITLLPETCRFFLAVADVKDGAYPTTEPAQWIVPRLVGKQRRADCSILILEDSHSDLGIPRAVLNQRDYLLALCDDYLNWLLKEATPETRVGNAVCLENRMYPHDDFLAYGALKRDPSVDLESLHQILREKLPITASNSYTERRHRALADGRNRQLVDILAGQDDSVCDFCGVAIGDGQPWVFPDGRVRCTQCSACGIDRLEQLLPLYVVARKFLSSVASAGMAENIDVKLVTAAELAAMKNERFIPTSGFDARPVGMAMHRSHTGSVFGEARHTVLMESGFSPEETASTLVHELTHTWQFTTLDFERMHEEHGKFLIEGHAVWAEKEFSRREAETPTVPGSDRQRLERSMQQTEQVILSDSEYGRGYRLLLELSGGEEQVNPFEWLRQQYPKRD